MKAYIDSDYKCHVSDSGSLRQVEIDFFDDKCDAFIEGYRFVPIGEIWTRQDGARFTGEMLAPWKPYVELDDAQREYERAQLADMREALRVLGVSFDG